MMCRIAKPPGNRTSVPTGEIRTKSGMTDNRFYHNPILLQKLEKAFASIESWKDLKQNPSKHQLNCNFILSSKWGVLQASLGIVL